MGAIVKCPYCGTNLLGGLIWDTGLEFAFEGKHYHQHGVPSKTLEEAEAEADKYAECYGATRTTGHWERQIGIEYDRDRIEEYRCPDCSKRLTINLEPMEGEANARS